ncbi:MAG: DNA primase [Phycisphaera sp.]|nr:DNA primase [Phycisphaera sp.]
MVHVSRDDVKRQVADATDIVQLIGEHVALTPRGREFIGLCPFHEDRKPSMYVVPAKQMYHCFACGAGGDAFSFLMNYHKMGFREALTLLAERANIKLPAYGGGGNKDDGPSPKERMRSANKLATEFFKRLYHDEKIGKVARDYVATRGINKDMVEAFCIGYAPDEWDGMVQQINTKRWDREAFELAGLIAPRKNGGGHYDRLRHRLIFPIFDNMGSPIAFGGRVLAGTTRDDSSDAKYLNSPETPLFNKSATLFGLHLAQKPIIDSRTAIIVEGYTDVIACHQAGVRNVVATLGTALTEQHAAKLRSYCDRVVLLFDADEAGQKAADRALQVFFNERIDVDIAVLPGAKDPAELFQLPDGMALWQGAVDAAVDAMTFQFNRVRRLFEEATTIAGKQRVTEEYLRTLVNLGFDRLDMGRRGLVMARLADLLLLDVPTVDAMIRGLAQGSRPRVSPPRPALPPEPVYDEYGEIVDANVDGGYGGEIDEADTRVSVRQRAERDVVGCLLVKPELIHVDLPDGRPLSESIGLADFTDKPVARLYDGVFEWLMEHEGLTTSDLREVFDSEQPIRLATRLQMQVEQLTRSDDDQLMDLLVKSVEAIVRYRSEEEYREQKMQLRSEEASETVESTDERQRRLELAVAHMKANPSAARVPRIKR